MKNSASISTLLTIGSLIAVLVITSCVRSYQDPNKVHSVPSQDMALITEVPMKELQEGHAIYKVHCAKCHEPKLPGATPSEK